MVVFVALFLFGLVLLALPIINKLRLHEPLDWEPVEHLDEHLASAVIVAALIGISYERFMHARLKQDLANQLSGQTREIENLVASVRSTDARGVFALLRDIAEHQKGMPTLYRPARDESKEFVLSTNAAFFKELIASRNSREQVIHALQEWCAPTSPLGLRFLGSDFIGLLQLRELAGYLRDQYEQSCHEWRDLSQLEGDCLLNYLWAFSRCEEPMYRDLRQTLLDTADDYVQRWILFVPRQMSDQPLAEMIDAFLQKQHASRQASTDAIADAVRGLGALLRHGAHVEPIVERHRTLFAECNLTDLVQREMSKWRAVPRTHHPHPEASRPPAAASPPDGRAAPAGPQSAAASPPHLLAVDPAEIPPPLSPAPPPPAPGERA